MGYISNEAFYDHPWHHPNRDKGEDDDEADIMTAKSNDNGDPGNADLGLDMVIDGQRISVAEKKANPNENPYNNMSIDQILHAPPHDKGDIGHANLGLDLNIGG